MIDLNPECNASEHEDNEMSSVAFDTLQLLLELSMKSDIDERSRGLVLEFHKEVQEIAKEYSQVIDDELFDLVFWEIPKD